MNAANVWVVDDERSIRWVLEKALSQAGLAVTCYEAGEPLLDDITHNPPDAIITDIRMPGISGFDLFGKDKVGHPELRHHHDSPLRSRQCCVLDQGGAFEYIPSLLK